MRKFFAFILALCLVAALAGCSAAHRAEKILDQKLDAAENAVEQAVADALTTTAPAADVPTDPVAPESQAGSVTEEQAKAIALAHAGVTEAEVSRMQIHSDWDDGRQEYDVEFHVGHTEYEYEIDLNTGKILSFDKDN